MESQREIYAASKKHGIDVEMIKDMLNIDTRVSLENELKNTESLLTVFNTFGSNYAVS